MVIDDNPLCEAAKILEQHGNNPLFTLTVKEYQTLVKGCMAEALQDAKPTPERQDVFYGRKETADLLHISLPTLHAWERDGRIKGKKVGGRVLYFKEDILNAIKDKPVRQY